jgi:fibronectin-binding autotransporter adhesin
MLNRNTIVAQSDTVGLVVNDNAFFKNNVNFNSNLHVLGSETLGGGLSVGGVTTVADINVGGNQNVTGRLTVSSLNTTGNSIIGGNESVNGNLGVAGTTTLCNVIVRSLTVGCNLELTGNQIINGRLIALSNATIGDNLDVTGSLTVKGTTSMSNANLSNLTLSFNQTIGGTLSVSGITTLSNLVVGIITSSNLTTSNVGVGTVTPNAGLDVNSNAIIRGNLTISNTLIANSNAIRPAVVLIRDCNVGDLLIASGSNSGGSSNTADKYGLGSYTGGVTRLFTSGTLGSNASVRLSSAIGTANSFNEFNDVVTVLATGTVGIGTTIPTSTLHVIGNTTISSNLTVNSNTTINGTLGVTGATNLAGNATVGGTLGVTGATALTGNASVGGTLGVTGATTLTSLTTTGNASVGGTLGVTGATTLTSLTTTGNATVGGTLGVTGATTLTSLTTTGNASVGGTLGVTGSTTLAGNATVGGTLGVTGATALTSVTTTGNATVGGTLGVTGVTTLASMTTTSNASVGGTLGVTGVTTLTSLTTTGNASIGGTLGVTGVTTLASMTTTGNASIGGTLGVTGATTLASMTTTGNAGIGGTLGVTGATTLASMTTTGNASIGGTLGVTGVTTLSGNASIGGTLGVTGATNLTSVTTTGNATVGGTLGVTGATNLTSVTTTGNASVGGTLGVTGATTLSGNASIGGTLGVTGVTTLASMTTTGNASVGGTLGVTGVTNLTGNASVGGTLGVTGVTTLASMTTTGNASVGGTLGVTGVTTLAGNASIGGTLGVTGATTLGNLSVSGRGSVIGSTGTASNMLNIADYDGSIDRANYGLVQITRMATGSNASQCNVPHISLVRSGNYIWGLGYITNTNTFGIGSLTSTTSNFTPSNIVITSSGNVGISSTTPQTVLDVAGSIKANNVLLGKSTVATGGYIQVPDGVNVGDWMTRTGIGGANDRYGIGQYDATSLFGTSNGMIRLFASSGFGAIGLSFSTGATTFTDSLIIRNNGHVGIGTTNPQWATHIANTGGNVITNSVQLAIMHPSMTAPFFFEHMQTGAAQITNYVANATTALVSLGALELWSSNAIGTKITNNFNTNKALSVSGGVTVGSSYNNTTTPANGMIVQGNVGIGITNPTSPLHVFGPTVAFGSTTATVVQIQHPNTGAPGLHLVATSNGDSAITNYNNNRILTIQTTGGSLNLTSGTINISSITNNIYSSNVNGTVIHNNSTTANKSLTVSGGLSVGADYNTETSPANGLIVQGKVGIGTTNPSSQLDVNGTARFYYGSMSYTINMDAYQSLVIQNPLLGRNASANIVKIVGDVTDTYGTRYGGTIQLENTGNQDASGSKFWALRGPTLCNSTLGYSTFGRLEFSYSIYPMLTLESNSQLRCRAYALTSDPTGIQDLIRISSDPNIGTEVVPWYGLGLVPGTIVSLSGHNGIQFRTGGVPSLNTIAMKLSSDGKLGIGLSSSTNPSYLLHLGTDSAGKPGSTTWTVASDERVKTDVVIANIDRCYEIVKNLDLKHYRYKDELFDSNTISDRSKLGWIAQDVEAIFPKAITTSSNYGLSDCKGLNADQIYAAMYGCIKKMQAVQEDLLLTVSEMKKDQVKQAEKIAYLESCLSCHI